MKVDLHYGKAVVSLQIPAANVAEIIRPWQDQGKADNLKILQEAAAAVEAGKFRDRVAGKSLCVLVDDGTRDEPYHDIFAQTFCMFAASSKVRFMICTGTHNPETPENATIRGQIAKAAQQAGIGDFEVHTHDCDHGTFKRAGRTSYGTEVLFNSSVDDADVFVVLSDVKVHYFSGYSNPIKNFLPGICSYATTEQNHSLALDKRATFGVHPWNQDVNRRNNPVAQDQLEGMRLIAGNRTVYSLVTISSSGQLHWARFGPIDRVSSEAFSVTDERNTHTVTPTERLIVSPGGFPDDGSLYIAQRALELTKSAVTDGGEILFLAECSGGVGDERTLEGFYNRLTVPIDEILGSIESQYVLYSHKPYKFAQLIRRLRRIWVYSEITANSIELAHLHPAGDPQAIVDNWLAEQPDARITVVDGANKLALYPIEN